MRAAGIEIECCGYGWLNGPVAAERMLQILRDSVLGLKFSEAGGGAGQQIKARVFEVSAAGSMLLAESTPHLENYFAADAEVAQFRDDAELICRARRLLSDPERRGLMARAAFEGTMREPTYQRRPNAQ